MGGLPGYGSLLITGNGVDVYNGITGYDMSAGFGVGTAFVFLMDHLLLSTCAALIDRSDLENRVVIDDQDEAQLIYQRA
jgi:hypothetical protein